MVSETHHYIHAMKQTDRAFIDSAKIGSNTFRSSWFRFDLRKFEWNEENEIPCVFELSFFVILWVNGSGHAFADSKEQFASWLNVCMWLEVIK